MYKLTKYFKSFDFETLPIEQPQSEPGDQHDQAEASYDIEPTPTPPPPPPPNNSPNHSEDEEADMSSRKRQKAIAKKKVKRKRREHSNKKARRGRLSRPDFNSSHYCKNCVNDGQCRSTRCRCPRSSELSNDSEAVNLDIVTGGTQVTHKHACIIYSYVILNVATGKIIGEKSVVSPQGDGAKDFLLELISLEPWMINVCRQNVPIRMTDDDFTNFYNAERCYLCGEQFEIGINDFYNKRQADLEPGQQSICAHHDHLNGAYLGGM